jgi:hypothetical protein
VGGKGAPAQHVIQINRVGTRDEDLRNEMIETGSKQEQDLASQDTQSRGRRIIVDCLRELARVRIEMSADCVRVLFPKLDDFTLQIVDIFLGTF